MARHIPTITAVFISVLGDLRAEDTATKKPPVGVPVDARWFNGKWYRVYPQKIGWKASRDKCASVGGQLAIVPDQATWTFIKSLTPGVQLWLGATDEKLPGSWKWMDGSPMSFKAWAPGEPNNFGGKEHYLMRVGEAWNDAPDSGEQPRIRVWGFICEWKDK